MITSFRQVIAALMSPRAQRILRLFLCGTVLVAVFAPGLTAPLSAQPAPQDIPPHLGYGVHFGPNTTVSPARVSELGMDWVKIYELEQAAFFPGKHILLRLDLGWPDNWPQFRAEFTRRIQAIAGSPVEAVEIHNEPNLRNEWGGRTPNAWQYTQLLRVTYTIVKAVAPRLIVVSGGLAPTITTPDRGAISDLDYAEEMFANGAGQWFDAFGYHPYGYNLPPETDPYQSSQPLVFRRTERIRALMEEYGIQKQIWLTEFGWMRDPGEEGVTCSDNDPSFRGFAWMRVSGEAQADYLVRAFQYAHENWPWAGPMFVWNLNWQQMTWIEPCNHMRWFGLLRPSGEPTLAFRRLASMTHYRSDYLPRLTLAADPLIGEVSLLCPQREPLGTFSVENLGYPTTLELRIQPVNMGSGAPFIEVEPAEARIGEKVQVFVNPEGLALVPGQYPVYINVRVTVNGQPMSLTVQGSITVWHDEFGC